MRVLFLIEGWISPAPRYRVLQYLPFLEREGVQFVVRALHGERYPFFYHWPVVGALYKAFARFFRRWYHLRDASAFDVVFQQRLSVPFSAWLERRLVVRNPRLVFDFDDAIYQTEAGPDATRARVFAEVVGLARSLVAGTDYLARKAGRPATVIPTVIDTDHYLPTVQRRRKELVVGWIGTASNYPNFAELVPVLEQLAERHPELRFRIVSDREPPFALTRLDYSPWHKDREIADLQSFDIGIMPLADSDWNRGKCAFKLIQYMAVGLPVVAGKVGANCEVVLEGETGFLAAAPAEWEQGLERLIADAALRARLGARGRERCVAQFSIRAAREPFLRVLRETAGAAVQP